MTVKAGRGDRKSVTGQNSLSALREEAGSSLESRGVGTLKCQKDRLSVTSIPLPHFNCDICGKAFMALRSDAKYCSEACRKVASRKKAPKSVFVLAVREEVQAVKDPIPETTVTQTCENCGEHFESRCRTARFCSHECRWKILPSEIRAREQEAA